MEGSIPTTPEAKPEIQELSVEHFSRLVFLSFRFSQGEPQLQRYILKWVSSAFPSYRITPANLELAYGRIKAMASNFVLKNRGPHTSTMDNQPITEDIVGKQVKDFSNALAEYLWGTSSESEQDKETILINIANSILERDYKYLIDRMGRPGKGSSVSQIFSYGFEEKTTTSSEYDQMFRELVRLIEVHKKSKNGGVLGNMFFYRLKAIESVHKNE